MVKKLFFLFSALTLVFSPILIQAQPQESQVQITISSTVQYREPFVVTRAATEVGASQAVLRGELISLGPQSSVNVFFQYREKDSSSWQETPKETKTEPAVFEAILLGLSEETAYEFRAGVEWPSETPTQEFFGDILEFTTSEEPVPPILPAPPLVLPPPLPAAVVFEGRAYPNAFLTILKNGAVAATFFAEPSGLFKKELTGIKAGVYTFEIFAQDTEARKSPALSFSVNILEGMTTTISGIFMPPTMGLLPLQVKRGDNIDIFGQAFPGSRVMIFVSPGEIVKEAKADNRGKWIFRLDTAPLPEREYTVRARAFYGQGEFSPFSHSLSFWVLRPEILICRGADLNLDGMVNIIDFSILLYFWEQKRPANICADINQDGIVNIIDFSIMMYEWTR